MAMSIVGLGGWITALIGLLYVLVVWLSPVFGFLFVPLLCYSFYRTVIQLTQVFTGMRMLRVMQEYPWRILWQVRRGLGDHPAAEAKGIWIELPTRGDSNEGIPLVFVKHHRASWWMRRIGGPRTDSGLKSQLDPLWFAGDSRFLGVVAVSGRKSGTPRRLHFLYQPSALGKGGDARKSGENVSAVDLDRARRAGAQFPSERVTLN
ncbi:hypothetical protein [Streptomyces fructofermentans]|uniref:Uncharacterized protein n=1 Tax=Streptomyces fructofermentans TaxID=152141 RepID=A0A918NV27_9ACTN|nr:hypothetical protein [Streptomyces fructofermentans]GGX98694.1 hypothetical protein GCM10010515_76190 [Streptomyces fructofermentans]